MECHCIELFWNTFKPLLADLSDPLVSLTAVQVVGLFILLSSLDSDEDIANRCIVGNFDYNISSLRHMVYQNYDRMLGVFTTTFPTIFGAFDRSFYGVSYVCLLLALFLRFSSLRKAWAEKRIEKIGTLARKKHDEKTW
ncbi:MAG: hypothetical protein ACTSXQ_07705 [Alphaproteobacteria bacterium]